jgi:hypothetical protein
VRRLYLFTLIVILFAPLPLLCQVTEMNFSLSSAGGDYWTTTSANDPLRVAYGHINAPPNIGTPDGIAILSAFADGSVVRNEEFIFPHIVTGGGYATEFLFLSRGTSTTGSVRFFSTDGTPAPLSVVC